MTVSNHPIVPLRRRLPDLAAEVRSLASKSFRSAPRWGRGALPVVAWAVAAILFGGIVGFAAIILPPTGTFGIVAVAGLILLWVTPDLPAVPLKSVRVLFFLVLVVDLCVPNYYAYQVGGLPWISIRRLFTFCLIVVFAIVIAGSSEVRGRLSDSLSASKAITIGAIGYLITIFLSTFTSINFGATLSGFMEVVLSWYVPLFVIIYVLRTEEDLFIFIRTLGWCALFVALAGVPEFVFHHRFFLDVIPGSLRESLAENNPAFAMLVNSNPMRNGQYRASSLFAVSLSFAEFAAIVAPFGYALWAHGGKQSDRILGFVIAVSCIIAIFVSGSRGGYVSLLVATAAFIALYVARAWLLGRHSLVPAMGGVLFASAFATVVLLISLWTRAHNMVLGGGAEQMSDDARKIQWAMGWPHIVANPFTGHGFDNGGYVVGYFAPGSLIPSVDSGVLAMLVETGAPSLFLFYLAIVGAILFGVREYLTDRSPRGAIAGGIACAIVAFGVYRYVLTQRENYTLFFLFLGSIMILARLKRDRTIEAAVGEQGRRHARVRIGS